MVHLNSIECEYSFDQAKSLLWRDISRDITQALCASINDRERFDRIVRDTVSLPPDDSEVLLDMYFYAVKYVYFVRSWPQL